MEFQLQHHSLQRNPRADLLQNGLVGSPCSPRDSQESFPTPQFKSINSSAISFLTSWQIEGDKLEAVTDFIFLGSKITLDSDCSHEIKTFPWKESYDHPSSVQFSSVTQSCPTLCDPMNCSTPGLPITISQSSLKLTSIESVMPSSHLILRHSLLLLPPIPPSIRIFSNESTVCMRWPKYWSLSFSIIPSKEHPGLISFRMPSS